MHLQIQLALQGNVRLDELADGQASAHTLHGEELLEFRLALKNLLLCSSAAVNHFEAAGLKVFNLTINFLAHLHEQVQWMHPRHSWCYSGEDYVQHIKDLTMSCTAGDP